VRRAAALAIVVAAAPLAAQDATSLGEALSKGDASVSLRYRYEGVGEDDFERGAQASTLRLTLGYATKPLHRVSLHVEFENVSDIGLADAHNNAGRSGQANGVTDRPLIADPEVTSLQQVWLQLRVLPDTVIEAGRREIALGNERFVGPVGWRQHHQSFDAVSVQNTSLPGTALRYSYVGEVHRIFGDSVPMASHLASVAVDLSGLGQLSLYGYRLVYSRDSDAGLSTTTLGGRFAGSRRLRAFRLLYDVELAHQADAADNPAEIDAGYFRGELGLGWRALRLQVGLEVLGGSPTRGQFSTPLATLHKFNGWSDRFPRTPENGLQDSYLALEATWKALGLAATYHQFDANTGGADYGREIDLQAVYSAPWKQQLGVKLAAYRTRSFASDTTKLWVWSAYSF